MCPADREPSVLTQDARLANEALRDAAERLVADRRDLAAGSVLRCFCRSVRAALLDGWPPTEVAEEAERRARDSLAERVPRGRSRGARARSAAAPTVPRPRRAR
jgi:hypothetical protein